MSQYVTSHRRAAMSADVCDCNRSTAGSCWRHPRSFSMPLTGEREAAAATPSLDPEKLAESIAATGFEGHPVSIVKWAGEIAAEYTRLARLDEGSATS